MGCCDVHPNGALITTYCRKLSSLTPENEMHLLDRLGLRALVGRQFGDLVPGWMLSPPSKVMARFSWSWLWGALPQDLPCSGECQQAGKKQSSPRMISQLHSSFSLWPPSYEQESQSRRPPPQKPLYRWMCL